MSCVSSHEQLLLQPSGANCDSDLPVAKSPTGYYSEQIERIVNTSVTAALRKTSLHK